MTMTVPLPAPGSTDWYDWATGVDTEVRNPATSAVPRLGPIKVASSQAPSAVKAQCDKVAPGTNDQTVINEAIILAARPADIAGGTGAGVVELVGGDFFIGNNNTGVWVRGMGITTMVQPMHSSYTGLGAFQLASTAVSHTRLSDLTIGKAGSAVSRVHGVNYVGSGAANSSAFGTGNDPYHWIDHVLVLKTSGCGLSLSGTGGGTRATQIDSVVCWESTLSGISLDGSSDNHVTNCNVQVGSGGPGFNIAGGNSKVLHSKSYYSDGSTDGFVISSGRCEIVGCSAQDNGRYGFNITGDDVLMSGCVADSNARTDATGGGLLIGANGTYSGLSVFDRAQTPASPQLRGIVFSGTPQVSLTGRVKVPSGTAHVVGAPGTNSFMRVVRDGTTLATAG